jgi:hypothetical protein
MVREKINKENIIKLVKFALKSAVVAVVVGSIMSECIWPLIYTSTSEEKPIREIIEQEANLVFEGRIDEVVLLFDENASVRDELNQTFWYGKDAIAERYRNLPHFTFLKHVAIEITVSTDKTYARAFSETVGSFEVNGTNVDITTRGEKWTFKKIGGEWKIIGFTCNIP